MTRVRRVDSYRSSHLFINQLSGMNSPSANPADGINPIRMVALPYDEMPQLNKYSDVKREVESKNSQTVSELERNHNSITAGKGFETVTLHLEIYEQMRKDQEKLKQLEQELEEMIHYFPVSITEEGIETYRINIQKELLETYVKQKIDPNRSNGQGPIDCSDIRLLE